MPFVSKAQRRACYAQYGRDKKAGNTPKWNCKEWDSKTDLKNLPEKIYVGPRGGRYILKNGKKIYI